MKRRSFIALALACLGIKLVPKTKAWEEIYDTSYHEWPPESGEDLLSIRMDEIGDFVRDQLAEQLWYDTRRTSFNELE